MWRRRRRSAEAPDHGEPPGLTLYPAGGEPQAVAPAKAKSEPRPKAAKPRAPAPPRIDPRLVRLSERLAKLEAETAGVLQDAASLIAELEAASKPSSTEAELELKQRERPRSDGEKRADDTVDALALIRATQMAVRGSARDEIELTLRDEFGLEDPRPILDEVLKR